MGTKLYIDVMPLLELQKFMERQIPATVVKTVDEVLNEYADKAVVEAKKEFGVYQGARPGQDESFPAWDQLNPRTIAQKRVRTGQNTPLLDSGELQASVEKLSATEYVKMVGTYDPNGARAEYGTKNAPARPWLRPVLFGLKAEFALELRRRLVAGIKAKLRTLRK